MNGAEERSPEKNDFLQGLPLSSLSPMAVLISERRFSGGFFFPPSISPLRPKNY
jgi:hypothetical protein